MFPLEKKSDIYLFTCTPPCVITTVISQNTISVSTVIAGKRDPINEIRIGQYLTSSPSVNVGTVVSINRTTRIVTMSANNVSSQTNILAVYGYNNTFVTPPGVRSLRASFVGAGQPGSGGHASSGFGGGGGGASSYWTDIIIPTWAGQSLQIICGAPGQGGAVGAIGNPVLIAGNVATPRTNIFDGSNLLDFSTANILPMFDNTVDVNLTVPYYLPTGRPSLSTSNRPTAGQAAAGGVGGYAGPEYGIDLGVTATGGTGATAAVIAGNGQSSKNIRGQNGWTGGGGGGGGGAAFACGDGGSDLMHTDGSQIISAGGNGGSSRFGKGGVAVAGVGGDGRGYGSGGAGGGPNAAGGDAGPGMCIIECIY